MIIDLFVEDRAHEEFLKPLIARVARDEHIFITIRIRSARGGHGRAIEEYKLYQDLLVKGALIDPHPNLMIVAIDGNCSTFVKKREEIWKATLQDFRDLVVIACPDPHVERWYLADPNSFHSVIGYRPSVGEKKCSHNHYKNLLINALKRAGQIVTLGGVEFAPDLVAAMDFYRAGQQDRSLKAFVEDLRAKLKQA